VKRYRRREDSRVGEPTTGSKKTASGKEYDSKMRPSRPSEDDKQFLETRIGAKNSNERW